MRSVRLKRLGFAAVILILAWLQPACSIRRVAANKLGDALAGSGSTFATDDDPELVKAAIPFSLKLMESLLAETPEHQGLLLAASSSFTQYAYAFVQQEADEIESADLAAGVGLKARAARLYLRARNYGLRGLEVRYPSFEKRLRVDPQRAVRIAKREDVPRLYWVAVSWAAAISLSKDKPEFVAEIPIVEALIDRAAELDDTYGDGAIHSFLITYEMTRQGAVGDPSERARKHYQRALELSHGRQVGPWVSFAEAVSVQKQDLKEFESLLNKAIALNADAYPETRLVNLILQKRARWLLARKADLFFAVEEDAPPK